VSGNALELGITCLYISRRHPVVYDSNRYQYRLKFLKRKKKQGWCPSLWPVKDKQISGGLDTVKKMRYFTVTDLCFSAECETQSPSMCDPLGKCLFQSLDTADRTLFTKPPRIRRRIQKLYRLGYLGIVNTNATQRRAVRLTIPDFFESRSIEWVKPTFVSDSKRQST